MVDRRRPSMPAEVAPQKPPSPTVHTDRSFLKVS
jgi:hypothetical protein